MKLRASARCLHCIMSFCLLVALLVGSASPFSSSASTPKHQYKLTYFNARGRGEVARQLLYLSNTPFEENRINKADWPSIKPKTLFNHVPALSVDGHDLPQSFAIYRYLAKEFGFVGDTPFESAWVDAIADQYKDYYAEIFPALSVYFGFKQGDKDQLVKDIAIPARDKFFTILEKIANDNGKNGHFVGSSLTRGDLLIADHVSILAKYIPGFINGFPAVIDTVKKIESTPRLKEWIGKRAETAY